MDGSFPQSWLVSHNFGPRFPHGSPPLPASGTRPVETGPAALGPLTNPTAKVAATNLSAPSRANPNPGNPSQGTRLSLTADPGHFDETA
jgi:hypothetical protein